MRRGIPIFLAGVLLLAPGAQGAQKQGKNADLSQIGKRDVTKGKWNFYSPEREMELGREMATEAERTSQLLRDREVVAYVAAVAELVARNSDARVPIQVRVVDSSEADAFALPGGFFFITTGMLLETRSEAELAGVVAHEIAHVAARHATRQMTRAQIWNLMSIPLAFFSGPVAYAIQQGAALAVPLTFLKFSRGAEREADFLGLQYIYASGYDPVAFVDFFERLKGREKEERGGIARAFATHPMTRDRIVAAERMIDRDLPPREDYVVTTSRHEEMRVHLQSLLQERARAEGNLPLLRKRGPAPTLSGPGKH